MNADPESNSGASILSATNSLAGETRVASESAFWIRRVSAGNPWYLISALMLLFGIARVSLDPALSGAELWRLTFSFGALQIYELLLIVTAVYLARGRIWHESTQLICIEQLLVVAPFVLISQASLLGKVETWTVCLGATALPVMRMILLKVGVSRLNMAGPLMIFGGVILAANLGIPLAYRWMLDRSNTAWSESANVVWYGLMPLLMGAIRVLPCGGSRSGAFLERPWLPFLTALTWVIATAAHLWCISYVDGLNSSRGPTLAWHYVAPLAWMTCWTVFARLELFAECAARRLRASLLIASLCVPILTMGPSHAEICWVLMLGNAIGYRRVAVENSRSRLCKALFNVSAVWLLLGFPEVWSRGIGMQVNPLGWKIGTILLSTAIYCWLTRSPRGTIPGGLAAALFTWLLMDEWQSGVYFGCRAGLFFSILHTFRWADEDERGREFLWYLCWGLWLLHGYCGGGLDSALVESGRFLEGVMVLGVGLWQAVHATGGRRWFPPALALVLMLYSPIRAIPESTRELPRGVLVIAGSFFVFGLATWLAIVRQRWAGPSGGVPTADGKGG